MSAVIARATGEIRKYEKGSRKGGDIEDVHKMRVATRRIRAYLKAARPVMDHAAADGLRADLRDVAAALGVVRDLDVMIDRLHQEADGLGSPDTEALGVLIDHLDAERTQARAALVEALDAPGYPALLTELDGAADAPPIADPWADLHELAGKEWRKLDKAHRALHRAHGDDPPDDDLHELRIWGKRARYSAELLRDGSVKDFLAALAALQEVLGDHQDASVLEERLRRLVTEAGDPRAGVAAGRIVQLCVQARRRARDAYPDAWEAVTDAARQAFPA
nr:CHAD domain-containing protein [Nakamurella flavida]